MLSLVLLWPWQLIQAQTKIFFEVAPEFRISKDIGGQVHFAVYLEKKIALNHAIGTGLKLLRYEHLGSSGIEQPTVQSSYLGVPIEWSYFVTPKIQIKSFVNILVYSGSLSKPVEQQYGPYAGYDAAIKKLDFDLGLASHYTITRRFKVGLSLLYAMALREKGPTTDDWGLPYENAFDPEHWRWTLNTHLLIVRIKKKKL